MFLPKKARIPSGFVLPLFMLALLFALPATALAHERRTIAGGKYDVVVGWDVEPTYVNEKNGATIRISQAGSNPAVPVEGADKTLKVQIRQGAQTKEFALGAVFGQPGYYRADIIPTRAGDYVWTFVGTINTDQINETFDSADGKFDAALPPTALEFPIALPDPIQAAASAQAAQNDAQTTRMLTYGAIGIGILGLIVGLAGWAMRPRASVPAVGPATEGARQRARVTKESGTLRS
jgi:hypothetical protein